ncbi:hypothetical protein QFZ63_005149 [Streptomyces sp. B3I7]|nr:hypothetical protein [Streptomyces sp. B3I8]MDQ0813435.1 hypothetical protein [Streptomyces sp. B3I7]
MNNVHIDGHDSRTAPGGRVLTADATKGLPTS